MNVDLRKFVQNFEPKPWMGIVVLVVMLGLLVLGTAAWIGSSVAAYATAVETATPTEIAKTAPASTPTPEPTPSPTKPPIEYPVLSGTPIPQVQVVWTDNVSVYLLAEPGKDIIAAIPNGETVEIRTGAGAVTVGNILWRPVRYQMVAGWLAEYQVYTTPDGFKQIGEPGTSLFREPEGSTLRWLNPGTPYQVIETADHWIKVQLPDERAGWLNTYAEAIHD